MAHITQLKIEGRSTHADGIFVPEPETFPVTGSVGPAFSPYLPVCPLRIVLWRLDSIHSPCPHCLASDFHLPGLTGGAEYYNYCTRCRISYVDVGVNPGLMEWLLPRLSPTHYWHSWSPDDPMVA